MNAPVSCASAVLFKDARDEVVIEEVPASHCGVHQVRVQPAAKTVSEPLAHGCAEAALATVQKIVRQYLFERAFQDVLAAATFYLQLARERKRILDQMMIQK